jgi:hypothetical protein
MTELKPCTFCCNEIYIEHHNLYDEGHCQNKNCLLYGIEFNFLNFEKWNSRPIEDALNKYIAELEQTRIADIEHGIFLGKPVKYWLQMQEQAVVNGRDKDINEILTLKKEIAELKRTLAKLEERNDKLEDLLHQIKNWCEAYPFDIAREPTQEETKLARKILKDADMSLSLFMISAMRRITTGITNEILGDLK